MRIALEPPENFTVGAVHRPVMLQKFSISAPIAPVSYLDRLILSNSPHFRYLGAAYRALRGVQVIREPPGRFLYRPDFNLSPANRRVYLVGYWQSHSTVAAAEPALRREFALRTPPGPVSHAVALQMGQSHTPISLHIRRGDYVTAFGSRALLSPAYYERALALVGQRLGEFECFVFSDDAAFARQWIAGRPHMHLVDHNGPDSAHEDLWLMSQCHHHVIANSSFSWWGAWFNTRPDKLVIAPRTWLGHATTETDIAGPDWILVDP
ncbi:MAG: alpha-1,2-fucosyltransferase [Steroidobacteraceae bacterium]